VFHQTQTPSSTFLRQSSKEVQDWEESQQEEYPTTSGDEAQTLLYPATAPPTSENLDTPVEKKDQKSSNEEKTDHQVEDIVEESSEQKPSVEDQDIAAEEQVEAIAVEKSEQMPKEDGSSVTKEDDTVTSSEENLNTKDDEAHDGVGNESKQEEESSNIVDTDAKSIEENAPEEPSGEKTPEQESVSAVPGDGGKKRQSIHLIGERHSGTNWMFDHLTECFGHEAEVRDRFARYKHWFQIEDEEKLFPYDTDMHVIAQFRNPYSWVEALRVIPYHIPLHKDLDWKTFVTRPYTMPRYGKDLEEEQQACGEHMDDYMWKEVIPCHQEKYIDDEEYPLYELKHDQSGLPYSSVIDLRADKIKNFLEVKEYKRVKSYQSVRYETMVTGGTEWLIRELEKATGIEAKCEPVPPKDVKHRYLEPEYIEWMSENIDWKTEELVGYKPNDIPRGPKLVEEATVAETPATPPKPSLRKNEPGNHDKKSIHLIGERHSGTNWMLNHLVDCFGDQIEVMDRLSRYKHWFQVEDQTKLVPFDSDMHVVAQFRNPFSWVEALRLIPYHIPLHRDLDWKSFVTKPYTMPRYGKDLEADPNVGCGAEMDDYTWNEVIPCHQDKYNDEEEYPIYELNHDKSGMPYSSVVQLRAAKIKNFLEVEKFERVKFFRGVQYEQMVTGGTASLIQELEEATGVKAQCEPFEAASLRTRPLDADYVEWMKQFLDWETEALVGYTPDMVPLPAEEGGGRAETA